MNRRQFLTMSLMADEYDDDDDDDDAFDLNMSMKINNFTDNSINLRAVSVLKKSTI